MATAKTESVTPEVPAIPKKEVMVKVKLPIIRGEAEDGVPVWVNNRRFLIKRGVEVEVPESVALILAEQEEMLNIAYNYSHEKET